jgi:hypothetical protein
MVFLYYQSLIQARRLMIFLSLEPSEKVISIENVINYCRINIVVFYSIYNYKKNIWFLSLTNPFFSNLE